MAEKNDFVEKSMTSVSETKVSLIIETKISVSMTTESRAPLMIANKTYVKTILKNEIKITKLNSDNYQSWTDGMQLLLNAKKL